MAKTPGVTIGVRFREKSNFPPQDAREPGFAEKDAEMLEARVNAGMYRDNN